MSGSETPKPRLFSRRWWTTSDPYWGEWRSGLWGWVCLALAFVLSILGVHFLNNTKQGWITLTFTWSVVLVGTLGARSGKQSDLARLRRHQYQCRKDEGRE